MNRRTFLRNTTLAALACQVTALRAASAGFDLKFGACDWTLKRDAIRDSQ